MTPADFYRGLLHQLRDAQDALAHLALELKLHLGAEAPRMGAIAARVARCCQAMQELAGLGGNPGLVPAQEENDEDAAARAAACAGHGGHWPRNRQDAYRLLAQIAEYLLYTEPHSPAPYLVKRAVAWGDMSPAELVQEICDSEGELKRIDLLLGTRGR
jgi:hypothetical protein